MSFSARNASFVALLALIASAMAMGISPVFVRTADVGPFASAFWRVGLSLPILAFMAYSERRGAVQKGPVFSRASILAGVSFAADLFFWHLSIFNTNIANATFFATTAPLFVALVGWLLFRKKVSRAVLIGLSLCMAGGAALVAQSLNLNFSHLKGDGYGIMTALFFGLYFMAVEVARRDSGAVQVTLELSCVCAALLLVVALSFETQLFPASAAGWRSLFGMAMISHLGGQTLLAFALGRLPALFSSMVIFLEALFAAAFAWIFLGEALGPYQIVGGLLILAGIYVASPREKTDRPLLNVTD